MVEKYFIDRNGVSYVYDARCCATACAGPACSFRKSLRVDSVCCDDWRGMALSGVAADTSGIGILFGAFGYFTLMVYCFFIDVAASPRFSFVDSTGASFGFSVTGSLYGMACAADSGIVCNKYLSNTARTSPNVVPAAVCCVACDRTCCLLVRRRGSAVEAPDLIFSSRFCRVSARYGSSVRRDYRV